MTELAKFDSALARKVRVVTSIAARAGMRPQTLLRQIKEALPNPIMQTLYLRVAESVRIRPSSLAVILDGLGIANLTASDAKAQIVGKNLTTNRMEEALEKVMDVITVTHALRADYGGVTLRDATRMVALYGPERTDDIVCSIQTYIDAYMDDEVVRRIAEAVHWFATRGLDICEARGIPLPNDLESWLEDDPEARRSLHRYIGWPRKDVKWA